MIECVSLEDAFDLHRLREGSRDGPGRPKNKDHASNGDRALGGVID